MRILHASHVERLVAVTTLEGPPSHVKQVSALCLGDILKHFRIAVPFSKEFPLFRHREGVRGLGSC